MEYIGFILCIAICTAIGYYVGKHNRKLPRNKVIIDLDTFEYLKERDDELWEIEKAERSKQSHVAVTYTFKENKLTAVSGDSVTS